MDDQLRKVKSILKNYNQEHLLNFYNELSDKEKQFLIDQILAINFDEIINLYKKSAVEQINSTEEIEPLPYIDNNNLSQNDIELYSHIGTTSIKNGELAVITLAGGQGSRLGYKGPKGTFELDTKPKMSLFEIVANYLKDACQKFNVSIPWYIMTSSDNYNYTVSFFENKNFFGYPRNDVIFFVQDNLPLIDINGKLLLEEPYKVKIASNGNGNLFHALSKQNLFSDMQKRNVKWVFVGGVDNVLLNPLDPLFIGVTIHSGNKVSSKTLFKENPDDTNWVFAIKHGKPAIVDCENFVSELSKIQDRNGNYLYRETNMLAHLFSIDALIHMSNISLPYHRAFRKSTFVNSEGVKQVPEGPNIYKFEQFVFDAFSQFDNMSLLRVNPNEEFSPIKSFNGPYNPDIAKELYEKLVLHVESTNED